MLGNIGGRLPNPRLNPLSRAIIYIILPFQKATNSLFSLPRRIISYFRLNSRLRVENKILRKAIEEYRYQISQLEESALESQRLRELLDLKKSLPYTTITAEVVARMPGSHTFVINKGLKEGIHPGKAVFTPLGLVGQVIKSEAHFATVMAITHPKSGVGAMVQSTREMGVIQGRGDNILILSFLPSDAKLERGDTVITSGMGGIYPKGIPIGSVKRIHKEKATISAWAEVEPFVDFNKIEEVLVVK
ncbi:rod shape-determining protein MreC [bacterium]|nr:rod shape-determining protein MreC [bacterium]